MWEWFKYVQLKPWDRTTIFRGHWTLWFHCLSLIVCTCQVIVFILYFPSVGCESKTGILLTHIEIIEPWTALQGIPASRKNYLSCSILPSATGVIVVSWRYIKSGIVFLSFTFGLELLIAWLLLQKRRMFERWFINTRSASNEIMIQCSGLNKNKPLCRQFLNFSLVFQHIQYKAFQSLEAYRDLEVPFLVTPSSRVDLGPFQPPVQ